MGLQSITSLTMLQGMRDNDPAQWARFVDLYSGLVYEWCRRSGIPQHDAADVVQEVFRAVAGSISEFRRDQNHASFHGWLWAITRHKSMDHFRAKAGQPHALGGSTANAQVQQLPQPFPEQPDAETFCADARLIYLQALELLQTEFE
ncbi:MAG: sigma-70 family RNA polymerase sigma factor, partial [Planctomycetaceae bacterium]|nr:sigma-70 family RNA polymerase sigma factor [Planctomycetaceae bacterium]